MKVAIYGKTISANFESVIQTFFDRLISGKVALSIYKPFYELLKNNFKIEGLISFFETPLEAPCDVDFLISIGGDGTFLESMLFLKSSDIPVIGLNSGRLGYLANIGADEIDLAFDAIFSGRYEIEKRTLIRIEANVPLLHGYSFALNEVSVQKAGSSLLAIDTWIDGTFVNTYWTDGLIIATPTGSTAYSLSVGGPIVVPGSNNFIVSPIASHNLTVRPIVVPDNVNIKLVVKPREKSFLITADNRIQVMNAADNVICIRKSKFVLQMLKLPHNDYYSTLRNKLMWGMDKRN